MSAAKSERLMNLLIMLLVQKRYIPKERIRTALYPDTSDEAFEKMFERDKEELRSLGAPIEVGTDDPLFGDEAGYRIRPDQFQLPQLTLDPDEAAIVALASRVWDHAGMAQAADQAGRKLAVGEATGSAPTMMLPRLGADEPSYEAFVEAAWTRTPVSFSYGRVGRPAGLRRLEPWGVVRYSGRWYVVGHDLDRESERIFRLSRVLTEPREIGEPGSFTRPEGVEAGAIVRRLAPQPQVETATVLARSGSALSLRRGAQVETDIDLSGFPALTGTWDRLVLTTPSPQLASELLAHGDDVVAEAPAELRDEIVARLAAMS